MVKSLRGTTLSQRVVFQEVGVVLKHIGARALEAEPLITGGTIHSAQIHSPLGPLAANQPILAFWTYTKLLHSSRFRGLPAPQPCRALCVLHPRDCSGLCWQGTSSSSCIPAASLLLLLLTHSSSSSQPCLCGPFLAVPGAQQWSTDCTAHWLPAGSSETNFTAFVTFPSQTRHEKWGKSESRSWIRQSWKGNLYLHKALWPGVSDFPLPLVPTWALN